MADKQVFNKRLDLVRKQLKEQGVCCLVLVPGPNLRYLTGIHFHLMERATLLFVTVDAEPVLLLPALEVLNCVVEAEQIIATYRQPAEPYVRFTPRAAAGNAATEAPRGLLYHHYQFDEHGYVQSARIVPPTAQNQRQIEDDLRAYVPRIIDLPPDQATWQSEIVVRNYDPCISCSTHFLRLEVIRSE